MYSVDAEELIGMYSGGWTDMLGDELSGIRARDVTHIQITRLFHNGVAV